jgi:archaellum component FlaF (FlaF/FlaG flagellin family)
MYKKFLIILFSAIILFISDGNVWAAAKNVNGKIDEKYTLINKDFFINNDTVKLSTSETSSSNNMAWIGSIFIMGLGQIIMGDILRGLSFYLIDIAIFFLGIIILITFSPKGSSGFPYGWGLNIPLISILIGWIIVYIWNIFDAYHMSQKLNEEPNNELSLLSEKLSNMMKITNKINVSNNAINFQCFSF